MRGKRERERGVFQRLERGKEGVGREEKKGGRNVGIRGRVDEEEDRRKEGEKNRK